MPGEQDAAFLERALSAAGLRDSAAARKMARAAVRTDYPAGAMLMSRERECSGFIAVQSGQLRAFIETAEGRQLTLFRLLERDMCVLTASCVMKNVTFDILLEAEKDSAVLSVPAALWGALTEESPTVKAFSMDLVTSHFSEVLWVMEQLVSKNTGQRIAAFLLEQSALEGGNVLRLTHETVANNLGTAREVVSRIFKYLENDGLIALSRGRVTLLDEKRLRGMAG